MTGTEGDPAAARLLYESTPLSVLEIARRTGVPRGVIRSRVRSERWTRPAAAPVQPDGPDGWRLVRWLYENTSLTGVRIIELSGITRMQLSYRAERDGWKRPAAAPPSRRREPTSPASAEAAPAGAGEGRPDRAAMIARLYRAFERQMADLEQRFFDPAMPVEERDARTLATLARTLERLIELDGGGKEVREAKDDFDLDALRQKLAERLARLAAGGE